ncbi:MAG: hypothetical protein EOP06_00455 [Proteobacteria bacterium]|nr:MAG: hypothetical protein EOP06_00455 [Pseudomonadota bacterium]
MAYDAFEAPETAIEREERAKAQRRLDKERQREENRKAHWESKEKAKESKTLAGNAPDDAREALYQSIADHIRAIVDGDDLAPEDVTDAEIIAGLRATAIQVIKVIGPSLLLHDGKAMIDALDRLVHLILVMEGRATHITEDKTQMTKEEREASAKRFAELLAKAGE